jgi:hypothetical protein
MKKLLLFTFAIVILQSCNSSNIIENNEVDAKLRKAINAKNDSLITAMVTTNLQIYYALESPEYKKHRQTTNIRPSTLFKNGVLKPKFSVYDEFYVKNSDRYAVTDVISKKHGYTFTFRNDRPETYVSLLKVSGHQYDSLLAVTYGLTDDGWKIYAVDMFGLGNWGIDVNGYYHKAEQNEEKGYLVNAYVNARNASELINRGDNVKLHWNNEGEIIDYAKQLEADINSEYSFPMVLNKISTKPAVLGLQPRAIVNHILPCIDYYTVIPLNDTAQLREEKDAIKRELRSSLKGINFNAPVMFRAYDNENGTGDNHHFIDK